MTDKQSNELNDLIGQTLIRLGLSLGLNFCLYCRLCFNLYLPGQKRKFEQLNQITQYDFKV